MRSYTRSVIRTERSFDYRRARAADAAAVTALLRGIYDEERYFVGDGPAPERSLAVRIDTDAPEGSLYLVATEADKVVGWLELHRPSPSRLAHVAVLTLAVAPPARRNGIARGLLRRSYLWCESVGVCKISLNVRAGNGGAIALYLSEGFEQEGRERRHVRTSGPNGAGAEYEDNLVMAKLLNER